MPATISRKTYADMYGPTVGDKVRLGDTDLIIEVERDLIAERSSARANALRYGDEVKFGGGKVIRDGMGQSQLTRAQGAMDTVIPNALIVDWTGIVKADVGLRDGRIAKIGKAGNPDTQPGVDVIIGGRLVIGRITGSFHVCEISPPRPSLTEMEMLCVPT